MLMGPLGAAGEGDPEPRRRAVLNTIGPVWDANEVWLITAGASLFAAFPNWYAPLFSALYLPLLAILFGMGVRIVGIAWRRRGGVRRRRPVRPIRRPAAGPCSTRSARSGTPTRCG